LARVLCGPDKQVKNGSRQLIDFILSVLKPKSKKIDACFLLDTRFGLVYLSINIESVLA